MVRLVFRPYTQVRRSICTSESLRTSIRVSPDFVLLRHSSPSFGSQRVRSCSASPTLRSRRAGSAPRRASSAPGPPRARPPPRGGSGEKRERAVRPTRILPPKPSSPTNPVTGGGRAGRSHFHFASRGVSCHPTTRAHVRLLGPCFKTGLMGGRSVRHGPWASSRNERERFEPRLEVPFSHRDPPRGPASGTHCEQSIRGPATRRGRPRPAEEKPRGSGGAARGERV